MSEIHHALVQGEEVQSLQLEPAKGSIDGITISDHEVGEYREQDRFLPVRIIFSPFFVLSGN